MRRRLSRWQETLTRENSVASRPASKETVGRLLVPMLVAAGYEVTGTPRTLAGIERIRSLGATGVQVDALDADGLQRAVCAAAPEVVIHQLTDLSGADGSANGRIRRVGTRNLVEAAKASGVGRIVAQSISWAYAPGEGPAKEVVALDSTATQPRARVVAAVRPWRTRRQSWRQRSCRATACCTGPAPGTHRAARFLGSTVVNDAVSSFVHVTDAATAALAALGWPGGPVIIVDDEPAPAHEWLPSLANALGVPAPGPVSGRQEWERGALNALGQSRGWQPQWPTWRRSAPSAGASMTSTRSRNGRTQRERFTNRASPVPRRPVGRQFRCAARGQFVGSYPAMDVTTRSRHT
ncbi:NAD-dependent epimerase/dehydratase family protein [Streptomyces sp. NPDC002643]